MMTGKQKLYFLLDRIEDERVVTPLGQHIRIHPVRNLNSKYYQEDVIGLLKKLESEEKVIKIIEMPNPNEGYLMNANGYYIFDLLPSFRDYFISIQNELAYQEFTGYKPPVKQAQSDDSRLASLFEKVAEVDEQIRVRRDAWTKAQSTINDNPIYSEATRIGSLAKLEQQAQTDIGNFLKQKQTYLDEISLRKGIPLSKNSQPLQQTDSLDEKYDQLLKEIKGADTSSLENRYDQTLKVIKQNQQLTKSQISPRTNNVSTFSLSENVLVINGKSIKFKKDARTLMLLKMLVKKTKGIYFSEEAKKIEGAIVDVNKDPKDTYYEVCRGIENRLAKIGITDFLEYDFNQAKINPLYKNTSK